VQASGLSSGRRRRLSSHAAAGTAGRSQATHALSTRPAPPAFSTRSQVLIAVRSHQWRRRRAPPKIASAGDRLESFAATSTAREALVEPPVRPCLDCSPKARTWLACVQLGVILALRGLASAGSTTPFANDRRATAGPVTRWSPNDGVACTRRKCDPPARAGDVRDGRSGASEATRP
jgi:hypothetical protein